MFDLKIYFVIPVWVFMYSTVVIIFLVFIMNDMYSLVFAFTLLVLQCNFFVERAVHYCYVIQCLAWCLDAPVHYFRIINVWS